MADALLEVRGLRVGYGRIEVVHGVDLDVTEGRVLALLGANGAGKTTTLQAILGHLRPSGGQVRLAGASIAGSPAHRISRRGVAVVPEGRRVFKSLTVRENLRMGSFARGRRAPADDGFSEVLDLFAELEPLLDRPAGLLSGGEQQMLAVGRALMGAPRLLVLDEPSMGLAPRLVARIYDALRALAGRGATLLLAEQNARAALDLADDAVVLATGAVALRGPAAKVRDAPELREVYLGG